MVLPLSTPVSKRFAAVTAVALCVLSVPVVWSALMLLVSLWTTDALKSIGMVIPAISFLLILRVWRSLQWEMEGSWYGFALLVALAFTVRLRDQAVLLLVLSPHWATYFPPPSLVIFAFGLGLTLLFGGTRLVRAAVFPLGLLLFVNPVPHIFNLYVDLPLQRASAHVARAFAIALGQPLSPDKLRLMFTPEFGMFIAPGCNGIRGAVTMGLIAMVAAYLYRFRPRAMAFTVAGAILLGYVFNLVRLCVLVLYYVVALPFPWLQEHAEGADYVIGGVLFFIAVYLLNTLINRLGTKGRLGTRGRLGTSGHGDSSEPGVLTLPLVEPVDPSPSLPAAIGISFQRRAAALGLLAILCIASVVHAERTAELPADKRAEEAAQGRFPERVGAYTRARTWNETLIGGALLFHWADYVSADGSSHVDLGVSPFLGSHDTLACHSARGDDPLWQGQATIPTAEGLISFSSAFFNDGATQSLEATTVCNGDTCGEYATPQTHFGFVYSKPQPLALFDQNPQRPIPILIKVETLDTTLPVAEARAQLTTQLTSFLSGVDLRAITSPYRRP